MLSYLSTIKFITLFCPHLFRLMVFIVPLSGISATYATQISVAPQTTYHFYSGYGMTYPSLEALISSINEASSTGFDKCVADMHLGACSRHTITHYTPRTPWRENGLPTAYELHRNFYTVKRYYDGSEEVITGTTSSYTATVGHTCPTPFTTQTTGALEDKTINCVYQEKESCPVEGNPINVGTAEKSNMK